MHPLRGRLHAGTCAGLHLLHVAGRNALLAGLHVALSVACASVCGGVVLVLAVLLRAELVALGYGPWIDAHVRAPLIFLAGAMWGSCYWFRICSR